MKNIGKAVLFPGTKDEVWGICESQDLATEANKKEIDNGEGDTVAILYTNCGKRKYSAVFTPLDVEGSIVKQIKEEDLIGTKMPVEFLDGDPIDYYIDSATIKRKKGDTAEFTLDGYYYPKVEDKVTTGGGGE